ncbi:MAG: SpaA isopeptide-forming pilin-related protein [Ndongobacter sp.]|nr:SpaA isopeptide-forming pilin-related protein [Ndongobacter sp.]
MNKTGIRRTLRAVFSSFFALLLILGSISSSYAAGVELENSQLPGAYHFDQNVNGSMQYGVHMEAYKLGGKDAFCVEPAIYAEEGLTYTAGDNSFTKKLKGAIRGKLELAVQFGYTQSAKATEDRAFTQMKIWETMIQLIPGFTTSWGSTVSSVVFSDSAVRARYQVWSKSVEDKIREVYGKSTSWNGQTVKIYPGQTLTLTDSNNQLSRFRLEKSENAGVKASIEGNILRLEAASTAKVGAKVGFDFRRTLFVGAVENPDTVFFLPPTDLERQHLATFKGVDPGDALLNIEIVPAPTASFRLQKQDVVSGTTPIPGGSLQGAVYDVLLRALDPVVTQSPHKVGEVVATLTTGVDGSVVSPQLPLGTYDVVERTASPGYLVNPVAVSVVLRVANGRTEILQETQNFEAVLAAHNAVVAAYNETLRTEQIEREEQPPFTHAEVAADVVVNERAAIGYFVLEKKQQTLIDGEGAVVPGQKPEAGISFDLVHSETGAVADTLTTGANGKAISKLLPVGRYRLVQKNTAEGTLPMDTQEIELREDGEKAVYSYENKAIATILKLQKTDRESGKAIPLPGVVFELYREETGGEPLRFTVAGESVTQFITDAEGRVTFPSALPYGMYYIQEVRLPDHQGYFLDPEGARVAVEISSENATLTQNEVVQDVPQIPQKGRLEIAKRGERLVGLSSEEQQAGGASYTVTVPQYELMPLEGVVFEVYAQEEIRTPDGTVHYAAGELVETIVTDEQGRAKTKELPLGKYYYVEKQTLSGYLLDETEHPISFTSQASSVRVDTVSEAVTNARENITFRFQKGFEESQWFEREKEAPGQTVFGLYTAEEITENGVTVPTGTLMGVTGLGEEGVMETWEERVPGKVTYTVCRAALDENGQEQGEREEMTLNEGELLPEGFVALSEEAAMLPGAAAPVEQIVSEENNGFTAGKQHRITTQKRQEEDTVITHTLPLYAGSFRAVLAGRYVLRELATGEAYRLSEDRAVCFTYDPANTEHPEETVVTPIVNELVHGELVVYKYDVENKKQPLSDVEFALIARTKNGEVEIGRYVTDEQGYIRITNLEYGDYYLQETRQKDGYALDATKQEVSIRAEGETKELAISNQPIVVEISKKDATTGEELAGAHMRLVHRDTQKLIEEWISGAMPHIVKHLIAGEWYTLIEDRAPLGYEIASSVDFQVQDTGEVQKVVMWDAPIEAPRTGDPGILSASALCGACAGLLALLSRQKGERHGNGSAGRACKH